MPQYAALHPFTNVEIRMLDCTSYLNKSIKDGQQEIEEAEDFYNNPNNWLRKNWKTKKLDKSDLIIVYKKTFKEIETFLHGKFKITTTIFHSHFLTSSREDKKILIMERI